ncbi:TadE family protein [Chloroflexus sp.]
MKPKRGQSIVEMALLLPTMLIVLFGIIEFGYLIFAYSMISQAARNGAEAAAQLPPYETWLQLRNNPPANFPGFTADGCVRGIMEAIRSDIVLFDGSGNEGRRIEDYVIIRYPNGGQTRNLKDRGPIEIEINYPVRSITPLFDLIGLENGTINLRVVQRRSIENLGVDPASPRGVACARDVADWQELQDLRSP